MKNIVIILSALFLASCKIDTDTLINVTETYNVSITENGSPVNEYILKPGTEKHAMFVSWFRNNSTGWEPTPPTFVPRIIVKGSNFSLNILGSHVILNYKEGQFVKDIKPEEYAYLLQ